MRWDSERYERVSCFFFKFATKFHVNSRIVMSFGSQTLQTAATADLLVNGLKRNGPILIVAPLSTLTHWHREFCRWTDLNAIIYHGDADDRKLIRQNEFAYTVDRPPSGVGINALYLKKCCNKKSMKLESPWMVQVVITTPEMMICDDCMELASVEWEALVVDEAHRMKNHNSKLAVTLRNDRFTFKHKILLTGYVVLKECINLSFIGTRTMLTISRIS